MKFLLLSLLIFSNAAMSADKKVATKSDETLEVSPDSMSKEMADQTGLYTKKHSMKAIISCKTKDGLTIKQGEKGYDECIKNVKSDNSDVKVEFEK